MARVVKITEIEAIPVHIPRDLDSACGTAGSPAQLRGGGRYLWPQSYGTVYSAGLETVLVRVECSEGVVGWGEAQAPVAPEATATLINSFLKELVVHRNFEPSAEGIRQLWHFMYECMRVRGHFGGFYFDAMSGIDLALYDLAGKLLQLPVAAMLKAETWPAANTRFSVPAYVSGVNERDPLAFAGSYVENGFTIFKVYHTGSRESLLALIDSIQGNWDGRVQCAVDGLWRSSLKEAIELGWELDRRQAAWFEAPMAPEDVFGHCALARAIETPLALGESYRSVFEARPFLESRCVGYWQPDLGRSGITGTLELVQLANEYQASIIPHISITLGPQLAAAIQLAVAEPAIKMLEVNPIVIDMANQYMSPKVELRRGHVELPAGPGVGISIDEDAVSCWRIR